MTDELPPMSTPRRAVAVLAILGVLALAVAAGLLAVSVLGSRDRVGAEPSSPAASEAATESAAAAPSDPGSMGPSSSPAASDRSSPVPSASTDPGGQPRSGLLPAGSVVTIAGDGVRIREAPSTEAAVVGTMMAGDLAYVVDAIDAGPVLADGFAWYRIEYAEGRDVWPWQDVAPAITSGWMAAGSEAEPFARVAEVTCPEEPVTLTTVAFEMTPWARLVCLGDAPFVVEGTFGCDTCIDEPTGASPAWLADVGRHPPLSGAYAYYPFVRIGVSPDLVAPANRDIIRATLRVDHPDAASCRFEPVSAAADSYDPEAIELFCRERVVLEAFEVIGTDDFGR